MLSINHRLIDRLRQSIVHNNNNNNNIGTYISVLAKIAATVAIVPNPSAPRPARQSPPGGRRGGAAGSRRTREEEPENQEQKRLLVLPRLEEGLGRGSPAVADDGAQGRDNLGRDDAVREESEGPDAEAEPPQPRDEDAERQQGLGPQPVAEAERQRDVDQQARRACRDSFEVRGSRRGASVRRPANLRPALRGGHGAAASAPRPRVVPPA